MASIERARPRARALVLGLLLMAAWMPTSWTWAEDIRAYAQACNIEVGEAVEEFDCIRDGTLIPMDGTEGGTCDVPPYLPLAGCHKYSRIGQQTTRNGRVGIVWLCRHKAEVLDENSFRFSDIAVIQTNFDTGATCFYQKLSGTESIDGRRVPKPDSPDGAGFWMTPSVMADPRNACVQCHDSGPFLRTPYVKQVNPAAFTTPRNKDNYHFPGNIGWNGRVYRVKIERPHAGSRCTSCHAMGNSDINSMAGTSTWLGPLSTGVNPTPWLRNGLGRDGNLAVWMRLGVHDLDGDNQLDSERVQDCALQGSVSGCHRELFGGQTAALLRRIEELTRSQP